MFCAFTFMYGCWNLIRYYLWGLHSSHIMRVLEGSLHVVHGLCNIKRACRTLISNSRIKFRLNHAGLSLQQRILKKAVLHASSHEHSSWLRTWTVVTPAEQLLLSLRIGLSDSKLIARHLLGGISLLSELPHCSSTLVIPGGELLEKHLLVSTQVCTSI